MKVCTCIVGGEYMSNTTRDKIIHAAVELVNEKGYKGATTREIAEKAEVNEVTLFRHFGNKKGLIDAAIDKFSFSDILIETFKEKLIWDIEHDLKMLSRNYQQLIEDKKEVILISIKEAGSFPDLDEMLSRVPQQSKQMLESYLTEMIQKGKLKSIDVKTVANNLLFLNFGYFLMKTRINSEANDVMLDDFIENNITQYIHSIR